MNAFEIFLIWLKGLFAPAAKPAAVIKPPSTEPLDAAPWMSWLIRNLGQKEIVGKKHNKWIVALFKWVSYKTDKDETPWCAALANAALRENGFQGTYSAAAKSFDDYGFRCEERYGAITTIKHPDGSRHVSFWYKRLSPTKVQLLGGNQSNELRISTYNVDPNDPKADKIVATRWPVKAST